MATRIPKLKERIAIFTRGIVCTGLGERHWEKDMQLVSDAVAADGTRTIVLKPVDTSEKMIKVKALIDAIAAQVNDESDVFKGLLADVFEDYWETGITKLYNRIVEGKEPVKAEPGCFKLVVGSGQKSDEIMLRD